MKIIFVIIFLNQISLSYIIERDTEDAQFKIVINKNKIIFLNNFIKSSKNSAKIGQFSLKNTSVTNYYFQRIQQLSKDGFCTESKNIDPMRAQYSIDKINLNPQSDCAKVAQNLIEYLIKIIPHSNLVEGVEIQKLKSKFYEKKIINNKVVGKNKENPCPNQICQTDYGQIEF